MIVGLAGYARSGKDTLANLLEADGWHHAKFSALLKTVAMAVDPLVGVAGLDLAPSLQVMRLSHVVELVGWERAKDSADVRRLLQRLGTDGVRDHLGQDVWVEATMAQLVGRERVVISDVRFPNEAQAVVDAGGIVVRVERPGCGPVNAHASETAIDGWPWDLVLVNDGTPEDLRARFAGAALRHQAA